MDIGHDFDYVVRLCKSETARHILVVTFHMAGEFG
jgi:hypothetical protein